MTTRPFTPDEMATLSRWEHNFDTAVNASWTSNPGASDLRTIKEIYAAATGDNTRMNYGCGHCILQLMRDCGRLYLAQAATELQKGTGNTAPRKKIKNKTI